MDPEGNEFTSMNSLPGEETVLDLNYTGSEPTQKIKSQEGNKKGGSKRRTAPYGPGPKDQANKRRHINRIIMFIKQLLERVHSIHPEEKYFFHRRGADNTSMIIVSDTLKDLERTQIMTKVLTYVATGTFEGESLLPAVVETIPEDYSARFSDLLLPKPTLENAWDWFNRTQTAKSLKPLLRRLRKNGT